MTLFTTVDPRPIHFMGIAGAGMSGLALLAKEQGVTITGCDNDPTGAADLAALGVEIWRGHDPRPAGRAPAPVGTPPGPGGPPGRRAARAPPLPRGAPAAGPPPPAPRRTGGSRGGRAPAP